MVSVAGAGPKSSAEVMKNVSEIERYTGTPGTFSANDAATMPGPRAPASLRDTASRQP